VDAGRRHRRLGGHGTGDTPMIEPTAAPEVEVRLSPAEMDLVRSALQLLLATLGRDEADEIAAIKVMLRKLDTPG
jgi:hypothetical protein